MLEAVRNPALIAYLALAIGVSAAGLDPEQLGSTLVNYFVAVPLYMLAIRWWTRNDRPLATDSDIRPRSSRRELAALAAIAFLITAAILWYLRSRIPGPGGGGGTAPAPDGWAALAGKARNAAGTLLVFGVPIGITFAILRLRPREAGLAPRYLGLGAALVASGIVFAALLALAGNRLQMPLFTLPAFALPLYFVQMFINGLPEELLFRGVVLQRMMALGASPVTAIVLSSVAFSAMHIPIKLLQFPDAPAWQVVLGSLTSYTGLVWGYLFYRTRSIWPGVLWHTSYTVLGVLFA